MGSAELDSVVGRHVANHHHLPNMLQ